MHYYSYPFKSGTDEDHGLVGHIDRLICVVVGLLSLGLLSAVI